LSELFFYKTLGKMWVTVSSTRGEFFAKLSPLPYILLSILSILYIIFYENTPESYTSMQYIKKHNIELYNKMLALKKRENRRTFLLKLVNKAKRMLGFEKLIFPHQKQLDEIMDIACEYMDISKNDYYSIIEKFNNHETEAEEKFENQAQTDIFWNNIDKEWLCINIYVQSILYNSVIPIYTTLRKMTLNNLNALDYGCGSGILAILLHKTFNFKKLVLTDIDNYAANFIRFYIAKTNSKEIIWENILECNSNETFDFVICLDLLEHLENSYEHLLKLNDKVSVEGTMVLKIAFEHEDNTHLPQAEEDFFIKNNGLAYLKANYKRIAYFGYGLINGIYKKH